MYTETIPLRLLDTLSTEDLIAQYNRAISSYAGRHTNSSPRQKRINRIVDLLIERAELGDIRARLWREGE
jgi:hypothetical protein